MAFESGAHDEYAGFEQGPIRPPSEAGSLLLRLTRNCAWNRCLFCPVYKGRPPSVRPLDHVLRDIDSINRHIQKLKEIQPDVHSPVDRLLDDYLRSVETLELTSFDAAYKWYLNGMKTVFLQDADPLSVGPDVVIEATRHLRHLFPQTERVTTYARSSTVAAMSSTELAALKEAGLSRIHVGLESGSDRVLKMMRKGASKTMHIEAGRKIRGAGMELSEYVMPGLGGKTLSDEHADETADAVNRIDPDFVRLRTVAVSDRAPLHRLRISGEFRPMSDVEVVREIGRFVSGLSGVTSHIVSDHILNLLPEIEGVLPQDKNRILRVIDEFLDLDEREQDTYRLGRRLGLMSSTRDLDNQQRVAGVQTAREAYSITDENLDSVLDIIVMGFI
ncbi:MAG: radical SAM protein [Candidatus Thorarchaeota archaeon]|nr:radical SAM protein [Candidatus Thorarchaeota archaeon]